jgi:hypothetical protein
MSPGVIIMWGGVGELGSQNLGLVLEKYVDIINCPRFIHLFLKIKPLVI